jgi:hypothetical protein
MINRSFLLLFILTLGQASPALCQTYRVERPPQMEQKLKAAYLAKGIAYQPRTEH